MGCSASQLLDLAIQQIGTREDPDGSNDVPYNRAYYGGKVIGGQFAWCATFVWWLCRQLNASEIYYGGEKTAYVPALYDWARKSGLIVPLALAQPGDWVIFDFDRPQGGGDHVAVLERRDGDSVHTIDGNANNMVCRMERSAADVLCVIHPTYDQAPTSGGISIPAHIIEIVDNLYKEVHKHDK